MAFYKCSVLLHEHVHNQPNNVWLRNQKRLAVKSQPQPSWGSAISLDQFEASPPCTAGGPFLFTVSTCRNPVGGIFLRTKVKTPHVFEEFNINFQKSHCIYSDFFIFWNPSYGDWAVQNLHAKWCGMRLANFVRWSYPTIPNFKGIGWWEAFVDGTVEILGPSLWGLGNIKLAWPGW